MTDRPSWWRRRARWQRVVLIAGATAVVMTASLAVHTLARHMGWLSEAMTVAELTAFLDPHTTVRRPDGEGPFPAVLLFSGCDGPADNMDRWSDAFVAEGYVTAVVDSHTPRDLLDYDAWRLVCAGQLLPGTERSGDALVSMAAVAALPYVDGTRLTLIGMSHGGWTIMDLLTRDLAVEPPVNLVTVPPAVLDGEVGVEAVVLMYPWCGLASRARFSEWRSPAPVLFILAREDTIAPAYECQLIARAMRDDGVDVEVLVFDDVTHGFDQVDHGSLSTLAFDAEATASAIARATLFVDEAHQLRTGSVSR